jgi:C4-dicarboxylate-specific signal transduction histidine kinase
MASAHELKTATLGRMTESIAKELNECLCAIVINSSTCLRMLSADPPNVEGARKTARRTICCSDRAAEAVSHLHALFSETGKRIETVAPSRGGSSRVASGSTL